MCFDLDSEPPIPRISGAAVSHDDLVLESEDGNKFAAFRTLPDGDLSTGVVILPDVRGLYRFYEELALRFAERDHAAIAFDYFGRTAGAEERDEGFDWKPHVAATTVEGVQTDLAAARAALAERTGATQFASVGFCFGGGHSFWAGSNENLGLDAVVGFYGALSAKDSPNRPDLVEHGDQIKLPVLGLFGGDDPNIPPADIAAFDAGLERAGVDHEIVSYPGAPHSFFDRKQEEFAEASTDAWTRVLDFLATEPVEVS